MAHVHRIISICILSVVCFVERVEATAYTATQTGNWSAQSTWGGAGPPTTGDTATIGAFTVTVDVNTTVGTSPNDSTTKVVNLTSASSVLKVAAGVTFTVKGNIGAVNGTLLQVDGGGTLTFDNSGSGGSPIYNLINVGFGRLTLNGSAGNVATIQAISGQKWQPNAAFSTFTMSYGSVKRANNFIMSSNSGATSVSHTTFDTCGQFRLTPSSTTADYIIDFNAFVNGTDTTSTFGVDLRIDNNSYTSGTRRINGNTVGKSMTYAGVSFAITSNYFGEGVDFLSTGRALSFSGNLVYRATSHANPSQYYGTTTVSGNYFGDGTAGNAHFLDARATGGDLIVSGNVFEQTSTYAIDVGDAVFPYSDGSARTITVDNNIVLPISFAGNTAASGVIATLFGTDATRTVKMRHNTIAGDNPAGSSAMNVAEGGTAHAGEVSEWKSNLVWGGTGSANQRSAARISGTVAGIITASGADYNFRWNTATGDNGRGYDDYGGNLDLWTGGAASVNSAANSNVDDHAQVANPLFVDPTRNLARCNAILGYGSATTSAALLAIQADPTRTTSFISCVRAGFAPTNPVYYNAGADGLTPGAVSWVSGFPALLIAP